MTLFLHPACQFWPKNGRFWAKIRHYGFLVQNFCFNNIALNSTDNLSPKPASFSKRFWKYWPKTAKIRPKSRKSASESESGPPFWNRSTFLKKNCFLHNAGSHRTSGENFKSIRPANAEKTALGRTIFQILILLVVIIVGEARFKRA